MGVERYSCEKEMPCSNYFCNSLPRVNLMSSPPAKHPVRYYFDTDFTFIKSSLKLRVEQANNRLIWIFSLCKRHLVCCSQGTEAKVN